MLISISPQGVRRYFLWLRSHCVYFALPVRTFIAINYLDGCRFIDSCINCCNSVVTSAKLRHPSKGDPQGKVRFHIPLTLQLKITLRKSVFSRLLCCVAIVRRNHQRVGNYWPMKSFGLQQCKTYSKQTRRQKEKRRKIFTAVISNQNCES